MINRGFRAMCFSHGCSSKMKRYGPNLIGLFKVRKSGYYYCQALYTWATYTTHKKLRSGSFLCFGLDTMLRFPGCMVFLMSLLDRWILNDCDYGTCSRHDGF